MRQGYPPKMPKIYTQYLVRRLEGIRKDASMDSAFFQSKEETEHIRERTDLWRRTWILDPLDEIISELKGAIDNGNH